MSHKNKSQFQLGVGLRTDHYPYLEERPQTQLDYFEALAENHMDSRGRPWEMLELIRQDYPLAFHGVSLNIASAEELDWTYLERLKELYDNFEPFFVSDHMCWTGLAHSNLHNLLPFAYNDENLAFVAAKIQQVQDYLQRPMAFENLSAYFDYKDSTYTEWEFLAQLTEKTGCLLLLDINNVYVNACNHGFDPKAFIAGIPLNKVGQVHLAGFSDMGDFYFDTHSKPVYPEVWELYRYLLQKSPARFPTMIEWDDEIPEFHRLEEEALKAKAIHLEVNRENQ